MANKSIYSQWTPDAIHCYEIKGRCKVCHIAALMEVECHMKASVKMLLEKLGEPFVKPARQAERMALRSKRLVDLVKQHGKPLLNVTLWELYSKAHPEDEITKETVRRTLHLYGDKDVTTVARGRDRYWMVIDGVD